MAQAIRTDFIAKRNTKFAFQIRKIMEEIRKVYHGLWRIEESFRIMKSDFDARPIYLNKREHIRSHFLICFVALVLLRLIQNGMGEKRLSAARLADYAYAKQEDFKSFLKKWNWAKEHNTKKALQMLYIQVLQGLFGYISVKVRFTFRRTDHVSLLFMAGCYNLYDGKKRFVILTTQANASMAPVHERMPLILERSEMDYFCKLT